MRNDEFATILINQSIIIKLLVALHTNKLESDPFYQYAQTLDKAARELLNQNDSDS